ncbi:MAG: thioesterase family protein [Proteobacteria bacterium]|nr:MAG: thioesterase family protein [Pseudomonadota bacterium]
MQHGGAPAALVTWVAERMPAPVPMRVARLTLSLMRPVPVAPLAIEREVLRQGRKIQLCGVRLSAGGKEVVRAEVLKIRSERQSLPDDVADVAIDVPLPEACAKLDPKVMHPFTAGLEVRGARSHLLQPRSGPAWFRVERPLIAGESVSQAMRAAVTADFCNTSSPLDFRDWRFMNADLTISMAREPVGDWVLLNAETWIGTDGAGIAVGRLGDRQGYFGRAAQTLVVEPR